MLTYADLCSENTITVTLALNVPVRKGLRIELWGLDGAQVRVFYYFLVQILTRGGLMARRFAFLLFASTKVQILTRGA
jgi:hypothetical protein